MELSLVQAGRVEDGEWHFRPERVAPEQAARALGQQSALPDGRLVVALEQPCYCKAGPCCENNEAGTPGTMTPDGAFVPPRQHY